MELVAERKRSEDVRLLQPLASHKFPYVGGNPALEAIPQVVHFGGFRLNQTLTQKVRILNKSSASTRMHIVTPTESPFHIENNRRGTVYPGMSEDLVVMFTGTEFKYYYDCIKVHSEDGNFIIPLHAYPVVNKVNFPPQIFFGTQPLGLLSTRTVSIGCSVPIEFEYRIEIKRAHSSITVKPLQGTIPANGVAEITIGFQPIVMANVFCEIELLVSQFGFQPMTCVISGASAPGLQLPPPTIDNPAIDSDRKQPTDATVDPIVALPEGSIESWKGDPSPPKRTTKKIKKPPVITDDVGMEDGIKIPTSMKGVNATNFVLTQQPGKLKPKDLKRAIDENRALRKRQKAEQEALRLKTGSAGGGRLSFDVLLMEESVSTKPTTRQLKELVFLQELQEIDKIERELEFQSNREFLGDSLLAASDIQFIYDVRSFHALERERKGREILRTTFVSHGGSVSSTPPVRAALPAFYTPAHVPDFNPYKNDLWAKRKRMLARFVQVVSKLITRLRAERRLRSLQAWIGTATTRVEVRRMVERDWKFAQVSITNAPPKPVKTTVDSMQTEDKSFLLTSLSSPTASASDVSSIVVVHSYPLYVETESRTRFPVAVPTDTHSMQDLDLFPVQVPLEADLMGYRPQQPLPIPQYLPLEASRGLRVGAQHEAGLRVPRAIMPVEPIPLTPHVDLAWRFKVDPSVFIFPPATLRVYTPIQYPLETDPEYFLQPRPRARHVVRTTLNVMADTPGTISLAIKMPYMLHTAWVGWRDRPDDLRASLWDVPPCAPSLIDTTKAIPIDMLSDSESDNDEADHVTIPTLDDAKRMFEEDGEVDLASLAQFPRYEAWLRLDEEYQMYRNDLCMQLPQRMGEIAKHVHNPATPFVVEGHGDMLPLHAWDGDGVSKLK
ncbi:hypothetical protein H310_01043 [Aphanomyces invadans]|uniref:MSP domain-containing protein n=1 Tax=Aphanomyces invadans TaxID=157072 RepID=A0A024UPX6_9STRA|nr:hypothetical protein H310_01043 [Aphanomyces invadans]ETW08466.1 hypothetical protein H310_01043 [Aphanomyces invadans]|eukprot:XP_008862271.1 hypothetical protein H310_01043 [Aphanomyces invadans]